MAWLWQGLASRSLGPLLLHMSFLVVNFFPLSGTLHPKFGNVNPGVAHLRLRRELHGDLVDHESAVGIQRNQAKTPEGIIEDVGFGHLVYSLKLIAFAFAVDLNPLIIVSQQLAISLFFLIF